MEQKNFIFLCFFLLLRKKKQSTPCKHPVIVLQDVAFNDLHALVEFIYHGEVNVHQRSLSSFLKTAEVLRVSGLTQQQAEETNNVSARRHEPQFSEPKILIIKKFMIVLQLAQIQSLGNSGARTPINHHPSFADKLNEDSLFSNNVSSPPHINNNMHSSNSEFYILEFYYLFIVYEIVISPECD